MLLVREGSVVETLQDGTKIMVTPGAVWCGVNVGVGCLLGSVDGVRSV